MTEIAQARQLAPEIAVFDGRSELPIVVEEGCRFSEPVRPNAQGGVSVSPGALKVLGPDEMRYGLARAATWYGAREEMRVVNRVSTPGTALGCLVGFLLSFTLPWWIGVAAEVGFWAVTNTVIFRTISRHRSRRSDLRALAAARDLPAAEAYFQAWGVVEMSGSEPVPHDRPIPVDSHLQTVQAAARELGLATQGLDVP